MHPKMLVLSYAEQQQAAERIHQLIAEGISSAEAIAQVAAEIRTNYQSDQVYLVIDEED